MLPVIVPTGNGKSGFRPDNLTSQVPVSKPGDLIRLGPHRLLCGDSTDKAAVDRLLAERYLRGVVRLNPENADAVLLDLLNEPEYERDVASELTRLVAPLKKDDGFMQKLDYESIWAARAGIREEPYKERRKRYATAIRDHIGTIFKERADAAEKRSYDFRLRMLGAFLARIDGQGSADLVFELMSLPDEWDSSPRLEGLEALLFNGVGLPTDRTSSIVDSCLSRFGNQWIQQQDQWLVKRCLCLLPFVAHGDESEFRRGHASRR